MLGKLLIPLLAFALLLGAVAAQAAPAASSPAPVALEEEIELEGEEAGEAGRYREFEAEGLAEFEAEEEEEAEIELEEDATAEEECEEATEEFEEGEVDREELEEGCQRQHKRSAHGEPPEKCVLRSAHGHAAVDARNNALKLTIGYTTYEPTNATIDIGQGASHVASLHRQLGDSGVIHTVEHLRQSQTARRLVVEIRIPSAESAGCPSRRLVLFPR
jgi:hypothetical protein